MIVSESGIIADISLSPDVESNSSLPAWPSQVPKTKPAALNTKQLPSHPNTDQKLTKSSITNPDTYIHNDSITVHL